jgi:hypothetical protein
MFTTPLLESAETHPYHEMHMVIYASAHKQSVARVMQESKSTAPDRVHTRANLEQGHRAQTRPGIYPPSSTNPPHSP